MIGPPARALDIAQIPPPPDLAHPPADVIRTPHPNSPAVLLSKVLRPGAGASRPGPRDIVTVSYTAWAADGATVDASSSRGAPSRWALDRAMEGPRLGIQLMVAGEQRRLWIPRELAGPWATGTVVFDLELIAITPPPDAPAFEEYTAAPADARRTPGGVAMKVLKPGTGTEHPKPMSTVTIHYTGWTADRTMFDDSVARGEPLVVAVDTVMPGLSEALQGMVEGEKSRVWIPAELAFTPPGPPLSALVIDVELLAIQRAVAGQPGTIEVRTNSPDAQYAVVRPDGTPLTARGPQTFANAAPGAYRIKPEKMRSYATGLVATPGDMMLAPAGQLVITITYRPIIQ